MLKPYLRKLKAAINVLQQDPISFWDLAGLEVGGSYIIKERCWFHGPHKQLVPCGADEGWYNENGHYTYNNVRFVDILAGESQEEASFRFDIPGLDMAREFNDKYYMKEWVVFPC